MPLSSRTSPDCRSRIAAETWPNRPGPVARISQADPAPANARPHGGLLPECSGAERCGACGEERDWIRRKGQLLNVGEERGSPELAGTRHGVIDAAAHTQLGPLEADHGSHCRRSPPAPVTPYKSRARRAG